MGFPKKEYLNIPVSLCQYVLKNKMVPAFKIYLYLKLKGNKIKLDKEAITALCLRLKIRSTKTVWTNINRLCELNWVGCHPTTHIYYVRGFNTLLRDIDAPKTTGVEFSSEDFNSFQEYLSGAFIGYLSHIQHHRKKNREERLERRLKGRLAQSSHLHGFYPVSLSAIAKMLNRSVSSCQKLRKGAADFKYIKVKNIYNPLGIPYKQKSNFLKAYPEFPAPIINIQGNAYCTNSPDIILPCLRYKGRKKVEHIRRVTREDNFKYKQIRLF
jgi:hypothetical protein